MMKKQRNLILFLIFIFSHISNSNFAQSKNITDIQKALLVPHADSIKLLNDLVYEYDQVRTFDSCLFWLYKILDIAHRKNDKKAIAETYSYIGYQYYRMGNIPDCTKWLNKSIGLSKPINDYITLSYSYFYLSSAIGISDIKKEFELRKTALHYALLAKEFDWIQVCYDGLSRYYISEGQLKEAASMKFKAMEACEKANDTKTWLYHAVDYLELLEWQDKKEEVRVFTSELKAVVNTAKQKNRDYTFTHVMGKVETKLKNYTTADSIFQVALKLYYVKQTLDTNIVIYILQNMTKLYMAQGNLYKAEKTNNELVELKLKFRDNRLTKDSRLILTEAKAAFDLEQKELQIVLSEEKRKQQNNLLIGAIILAVLLGSFLFILQRNKRHIEQQKIELEKLNATKNRLFALLSHDLLSPIANLKNVMMLVDWQLLNQEEFTATSKDLTNKVNNLYNMFENVLHWSISQMHGIKVNKETVKVKEIVDEQITLLKPFAESKNIHISTDIPTNFDLMVDRNHFALILRNLLQNALKFTNTNGVISFKAQKISNLQSPITKNTEGGYLIEIKDNGIGMSADVLTKLFKTTENANRKGTHEEAGTGLGLILTKELVELNRGQISVSSEVGKGTTFGLRF